MRLYYFTQPCYLSIYLKKGIIDSGLFYKGKNIPDQNTEELRQKGHLIILGVDVSDKLVPQDQNQIKLENVSLENITIEAQPAVLRVAQTLVKSNKYNTKVKEI